MTVDEPHAAPFFWSNEMTGDGTLTTYYFYFLASVMGGAARFRGLQIAPSFERGVRTARAVKYFPSRC